MNIQQIKLSDYTPSGAGNLGESYISNHDPNVLLKLYSTQMTQAGIAEYERAKKVFDMGVPCPEPGSLVQTEDGRIGVQFRLIKNKKSYSRALSEHPELVEQYASEFAAACKELHSMRPAPGLFPTVKDQYTKSIIADPFLNDIEKEGLKRYIADLPDSDTALHGDLHYGNIIFTPDGKQYFIDLGDFCTGSPLFDLGIVFRQTCRMPEDFIKKIYHIDLATAHAFWRAFASAYFGQDMSLDEVEAMLEPYNMLRALVLEHVTGKPHMQYRPFIASLI